MALNHRFGTSEVEQTRHTPRLARYDPNARHLNQAFGSHYESLKNWNFFEHPVESYLISTDGRGIYARKQYSQLHRTNMLYFGKHNIQKGQQVVAFSEYEAVWIHRYVTTLLKEIETHPPPGQLFSSFIPHFQEKENPADASAYDKVPFWDNCDMTLNSVCLRMGITQRSAEYELYITSSISAEASGKKQNWAGPVLVFSVEAMRNLVAYIELMKQVARLGPRHAPQQHGYAPPQHGYAPAAASPALLDNTRDFNFCE